MTSPDTIVQSTGEELTLTRVTEYDAGRDGVTGVTRVFKTVKGIVSSPSEEAQQRLEGRLEDGAITVTLPSGTDVAADRDGGRDRLLRPATDPENPDAGVRLYTIVNVTRDRHPMTGTEKLTVVCNEFGGREDLANDADEYVEA